MEARLSKKEDQKEYLILQVRFYFQLRLKTNVFPVFKQEIHSFLCREKICKGSTYTLFSMDESPGSF